MTFMNIYYPSGNRFVFGRAFIKQEYIHIGKQQRYPKGTFINVYNRMMKP